ncbi:MAG TPA: hypothetical protein VGD71_24720, partial [Kribbella sp.]
MRIRNVGVLAGLLSVVSVVAACGSTGTRAGSGSAGNTLVVDSKFSFTSKDADPARGGVDFTAVPLFHAMYDTLLTFANNDYTTPVASLASKFTPSADDKTFT